MGEYKDAFREGMAQAKREAEAKRRSRPRLRDRLLAKWIERRYPNGF